MVRDTYCAMRHELEISIEAPVSQVWQTLTDRIGEWWPADFFVGKDPQRFVLEAKLGGRMYEDWGGGQGLVWGIVGSLRRNELLQIQGELFPEFGGPGRVQSTYSLESAGDGTLFKFSEVLYGSIDEKGLESISSGWKHLFTNCMKPHAEK